MGVGEMPIDELTVLDVDERGEVGDGGEEESESPWWRNLDEEVGDYACREGLSSICQHAEGCEVRGRVGRHTPTVAQTFSANTIR